MVLFAGALLGCSPVLRTLTLTYSDDTIWALTLLFLTVHVFVHDYHFINTGSEAK
jgi:phosphatidylinositol glycan class C protein